MTPAVENIFENIVRGALDEQFSDLVSTDRVRIERIVSTGQASAPDLQRACPTLAWVVPRAAALPSRGR